MIIIKKIGDLIGVIMCLFAGLLIWGAGYLITDDKLAGDIYGVIKKAFNEQ